MRKYAGIALLLILAACATTTPKERALATVSASQASLTATGRLILACYSVPRCGSAAPKAQIKRAYNDAYVAVTEAQKTADAGGSPDMTATTAAMSALQGLVNNLPQS